MKTSLLNEVCSRRIHFKTLLFPTLSLFFVISIQTYGQLAQGQSKFLGNIIGTYVPGNYDSYWNQITMENAGKWDAMEPNQGTFSWESNPNNVMVQAYEKALDKEYPFKAHTFIWRNQAPNWLAGLSINNQKNAADNMMNAFFNRFPETAMVDVVNEPLDGHAPAYGDNGGWMKFNGDDDIGKWSWIKWSFERAKIARNANGSNAKLLINDYGIVENDSATNDYVDLVNAVNADGRNLIEGIGVQCHFAYNPNNCGNYTLDTEKVKRNLDKLATTGLPIYVSEFDLNLGDDDEHNEKFMALFRTFYEHPAVVGVTLWGVFKNETWLPCSWLIDGSTERKTIESLREYLQDDNGNEQTPFKPHTIPGTVQAEDYDNGGQNIAYNDTDDTNNGGQGRTNEGVDIENTTDNGGGTNVGWIANGEWLEYTIANIDPGTYDITFRVASTNSNTKSIETSLGSTGLGSVNVPNTGGWQSWEDIELSNVNISNTGQNNVLRLDFQGGAFNVNWVKFEKTTTGGDEVDGGVITGGPFSFTVNDGTTDNVDGIVLSNVTGSNTTWVITNDEGIILGLPQTLQALESVDFDTAEAGTCFIWHMSHEDDLEGAVVGNDVAQLSGTYDLSNSISVIRNTSSGGDGDCSFGTPIATSLPAIPNTQYDKVYVLGDGGPNLDNLSNFTINWDLANNGLYQFSILTNNGIPSWWSDLIPKISQNFNSAQPSCTLADTGYPGLDGTYDVTVDNGNFVMVSQSGGYTIYFSNANTAPDCSQDSKDTDLEKGINAISVYPNPANSHLNLKIINGDFEKEAFINIYDSLGRTVLSSKLDLDITTLNIDHLAKGNYYIKVYNQGAQIIKRFIKY